MNTIAYWASQHVWGARFLLTICMILLIVTGTEFGIYLKAYDTAIPSGWMYFFALLGFLVLVFGPDECFLRQNLSRYNFPRFLSGVVAVSVFMLSIIWGSQLCSPSFEYVTVPKFERAAYSSLSYQGQGIEEVSHCIKLTVPFQKIFQKKALKRMQKWRSGSHEGKSKPKLIGALFCVLGTLLLVLVLVLSCGLACSESYFFSIFVLLLGMAGVFYVFYLAAKRFYPNKSKRFKWRFAILVPTLSIIGVFLLLVIIALIELSRQG